MITIWADQMAMGLKLAQLALAAGLLAATALRLQGRQQGLAAILKGLAFLPVSGFVIMVQLIDPLLSEAHADQAWLLVCSIVLLDTLFVIFNLTLVHAARRAGEGASAA